MAFDKHFLAIAGTLAIAAAILAVAAFFALRMVAGAQPSPGAPLEEHGTVVTVSRVSDGDTFAKTARRSALQYREAYSPEGASKRYLPVG